MKYKFLLDENIFYCAIKGVDEHDNEELTAADLVRLIAENCHQIVYDKELLKKYYGHLQILQNVKSPILETLFFFTQLIKNQQKTDIIHESSPPLIEESIYPRKDVHVVRTAHYFQAITITYDKKLRDAINAERPSDIRALHPREAIQYAKES